MKFKILLLILVSVQLVFSSTSNEERLINKYLIDLSNLTPSQYDVMTKSYKLGLEIDLGYILTAIAWKESNFGDYMLNLSDGEYGSFGPYHIRLDYSIKRNNLTSKWLRDRHAEKLIYDLEYSAIEALEIINYWRKYFKPKLKKDNVDREIFSAYNGGYSYNNKDALSYGNDAIIRVKALKRFFAKHSLEDRIAGTSIVKQPLAKN